MQTITYKIQKAETVYPKAYKALIKLPDGKEYQITKVDTYGITPVADIIAEVKERVQIWAIENNYIAKAE